MSTPSLSRVSAALALVFAALCMPALAGATCLNQCEAHLMTNTCETIQSVAPGDPVLFWIACQTCCAAPGGPLNCSELDPYTLSYKLTQPDSSTVAGFVSPSQIGCPGKTGWALAFIADKGLPLAPGTYNLIQDSMILVDFQVIAGGTETDAGSDASDAGSDVADTGSDVADAGADAIDAGSADTAEADASVPVETDIGTDVIDTVSADTVSADAAEADTAQSDDSLGDSAAPSDGVSGGDTAPTASAPSSSSGGGCSAGRRTSGSDLAPLLFGLALLWAWRRSGRLGLV